MKIKTRSRSYDQVMALKRPEHKNPIRPLMLLGAAIRLLSLPTLWKSRFTYDAHRMDQVGNEPCLILMNHSCFMDLKIAYRIFFPKRFCIVCTTDGFVGFCKAWLMRLLGCIPTKKFVTDVTLIKDIRYALKELNTSVLMFPEASYSFDGRATALPRKLGVLLKKLDVPLVTVITQGAFARDPLYNNLQKRRVKVRADVRCLLTREEIREKSVAELDAVLDEVFSFDNFRWQQENRVKITEPFRADGLNRVLYQCAACGAEGQMEGKGTRLVCRSCGKEYELDQFGYLRALTGETEFDHIPDWYDWQRQQVRRSLEDGSYRLDTEVDIAVLADYKAVYKVGSGRLIHDENGFVLDGCDGALHFEQGPRVGYCLNADYYWYELGDVICVGDQERLYYCFPKEKDVVTRARIATEELYKMKKRQPRLPKRETPTA